jgi:hypothetical protein
MMKTHPISCLVSALALACGAASLEARADAKAAETPAAAAAQPNPKGMLDKGMSASDVVKLIGKPASVTELKMDEGKAEKWIYRQLVSHREVQEETSVANEAAFVGNGGAGNNDQGSRVTLLYSMKHISIYQTTALLMVNDHLVVAKQWNEEQVSYEH